MTDSAPRPAREASARQPQPRRDDHAYPAGLCSDYLNHFNEALMLLELASEQPDGAGDLASWRPRTYREHFVNSRLPQRESALAAYEQADPATLRRLQAVCGVMTAAITAARTALQTNASPAAKAALARQAAARLRPLLARAGAIMHGVEPAAPPRRRQALP